MRSARAHSVELGSTPLHGLKQERGRELAEEKGVGKGGRSLF